MDENFEIEIGAQMREQYRQERTELKKARRSAINNKTNPEAFSASRSGSKIDDTEKQMKIIFKNIVWSVLPYIFKYDNLPPSLGPQGMQIVENFMRQGMPIPIGGTNKDDIHIITMDTGTDNLTWNPLLSSMIYTGTTIGENGDSYIETELGKYRPIDVFNPSSSRKQLDYGEGVFTVFTNKSLANLAPGYNNAITYGVGGAASTLSDIPLIDAYVDKLANIYASHYANIRSMRQSTAVFLNNQNPDMLKIFEDTLAGVPFVTIDSEVDIDKLMKPIVLNNANYIETLQSAFDQTWNLLWRMLGMSSNGVSKNSGVNALETASNAQITEALMNAYLDSRQQAWNQLNIVLGSDVQVSINSDAQKMIDAMMQAQIYASDTKEDDIDTNYNGGDENVE